MRLVEIFENGERLEQHRAVVLDQRRQRHHRIDLAKGVLALLALHQVDVDHLVGRDALEVERDAHAEGRQRAPERKQFHGWPPRPWFAVDYFLRCAVSYTHLTLPA